MHTSTPILALLSLSTTSLASSHGLTFHAMLARGSLLQKRQDSYYPTPYTCGTGNTCAEACGADFVQCPTSAGNGYCHLSTDGSQCCSDGYYCDEGYYCTSDSAGVTYCCLDGIDTAECARQYSLSGSLVRDTTSTAAAEVIESATFTGEIQTTTEVVASTVELAEPSSDLATLSQAIASLGTPTLSASVTLPSASIGNGSVSTPSLPEFTGGAVKGKSAGVALLAGAAGLVFL